MWSKDRVSHIFQITHPKYSTTHLKTFWLVAIREWKLSRNWIQHSYIWMAAMVWWLNCQLFASLRLSNTTLTGVPLPGDRVPTEFCGVQFYQLLSCRKAISSLTCVNSQLLNNGTPKWPPALNYPSVAHSAACLIQNMHVKPLIVNGFKFTHCGRVMPYWHKCAPTLSHVMACF